MRNNRHWEEVILDQKEAFLRKDPGIPREADLTRYLKSPHIVVFSGVRRCGKSTLLRQIAARLDAFYYINFDDERLIDFTVADFSDLMVIFQKQYPARFFLADEIQNVPGWERFIRRLHDEGYKVFLTGSNARLLSSEMATHLTGRHLRMDLYPFSFREFLAFHQVSLDHKTSSGKARVLKFFDRYLLHGGFPERIKYDDSEFVKRVYEDILHRDIIARFQIREVKAFKQLAHYLFSNFTSEISYNSLKNILGFKTAMSVRNYVGFMEESYLLFELFKYDYSLKKQHVNNKKVYVIDGGMRNAVAFHFSGDRGKYLENMVFLELKRRGHQVYFFRNRQECDFVVEAKGRISQTIQVCLEVHAGNRKRELDGLMDAMKTLGVSRGLVLTLNQAERITLGKHRVEFVPAWEWLLGA
ncbi:MAG: ATP-binding protein [Verrucomicrobia bacterium]|nr:ATP-binding protein [Verrucomicrobiota bacterium]